jgi:hypothetical protein
MLSLTTCAEEAAVTNEITPMGRNDIPRARVMTCTGVLGCRKNEKTKHSKPATNAAIDRI